MTITIFYTNLKPLTNTLRGVGSPINDYYMMINLIRGMNKYFGHCIAALNCHPGDLMFTKARFSLLTPFAAS
jgi:hypothetical protein